MSYQFQPHGDCDVWLSDRTVYARLKGSWNKQAAEAFEKEFKGVAAPLVGKPWSHLVYLEDWELCTPDMFPVIERLVAWCIENGLVRAAQVFQSSVMKQQFVDKMVVEEQGAFKRAVFESAEDASQWLAIEMAYIN